MASSQGAMHGQHGGARENSGRKKVFANKRDVRKAWGKAHKRIYLTSNIFKTWSNAKIMAGYEKSTDSDFAAHLLSLEFRRRLVTLLCQ